MMRWALIDAVKRILFFETRLTGGRIMREKRARMEVGSPVRLFQ